MIRLNYLFPNEQDFNLFLTENKPIYSSLNDNEITDLGSIFYKHFYLKIINDNYSDRFKNELLEKFWDISEFYRYFINGDLIKRNDVDSIGDFEMSANQKTINNGLADPNFYSNFIFKKANISTRIELLKKGSVNQIKRFLNEFYYFFLNNDSF